MKPIKVSRELREKLKVIESKDKKLFKQAQKQLLLFQQNPRHVSLRLHKLKGNLKNTWSISINRSFRLTYTEEDDYIYFIDIGTHDEVYHK